MADNICGYEWRAPFTTADKRRNSVRQTCALPKGHTGDHRSMTKVTAPNEEKDDGR